MGGDELLPSTVDGDAPSSLRGLVEFADPDHGIIGWALNLAEPDADLQLELLAGEILLGSCRTNIVRHDLLFEGRDSVAAGFCFNPLSMTGAAGGVDCSPEERLRVRIAGTTLYLQTCDNLPPAVEFLARAATVSNTTAPSAVLTMLAVSQDPVGALETMRGQAELILRQPLTPATNAEAGFIEAMGGHTLGFVWLFGWMRRAMPQYFAGVIVDGRKHPAALVATRYERADLPPDACGIVGLLRSNWRPSTEGGGPLLFFGERAEHYLGPAEKFSVLTDNECIDRFKSLRAQFNDAFARPLYRAMSAVDSWAIDNARAAGIEVRAHLDRILILPGFGCLVEGWLLSPVKIVSRMMLRAGDVIMAADESAAGRKPRPDLASIAGDGEQMLESAGFVTVFRGDVQRQDLDYLVLKLVYADGTASNHSVDAAAVRVLGYSVGFEELLQLYPAAEGEIFFPELAQQISVELGRQVKRQVSFEVQRADRAILVALSNDISDAGLIVSELAWYAAEPELTHGIALLAQVDSNRARTLAIYQELRRVTSLPCSLFFVPTSEYAIYAAPQILSILTAHRFAFLAPGVFPTAAGWKSILNALSEDSEEPLALRIFGETGEEEQDAAVAPPECFVWNSSQFETWIATIPVLFGAAGIRSLCLPTPATQHAPEALLRRGRKIFHTKFSAQVNARLLERC